MNAVVPVRMLATMIQGGRGGIYRYVIEIARRLTPMPELDVTVDCLAHEQDLLPNMRLRTAAGWDRGGVADLLRAHAVARAPRHGVLFVPSYRRVPWLGAARTVATVHDLAPLHMPEKYGWARHRFLAHVVPLSLRRCRRIIAVTQHTANDLVQAFAIDRERISVIPNGIDHATFAPGDAHAAWLRVQQWCPDIARQFVLCMSRVEHPGKGHMALLEAWSRLPADRPQLVFAGALVERHQEVLARAQALGVRVVTTGFVPNDAMVADLYRACLLMVFPSRYEGFGLPPVEAMACATPVLSSRRAALAETAGPAAPIDPDDLDGMHAALLRYVYDQEQRARLATLGPAWAAQFSWDAAARAHRDVLVAASRT